MKIINTTLDDIENYNCRLTVSSTVESVKPIEICILEAFVATVESPHHTGPRSTEDEIAFTLAVDDVTVLVE